MSSSAVESRSSAQASDLWVERTDIRFRDVAPGRVRIEVEVENRGAARSVPRTLLLQAAPFGAFLAWRPVAQLEVPALEPGRRAVVACERRRPRVQPVADFSGFVPPHVRTALGTPDESARPSRDALPTPPGFFRLLRALSAPGQLPPDLHALVGRESPHWAGNVNVLIGARAVERHMTQALRVHPGRANLALFMLGAGADSYALQARGSGAAWPYALLDPTRGTLVRRPDGTFELPGEHWGLPRVILFACRPPADCGPAAIEIHVERRPQGDQAVVEFSLDPGAAGPGCYAL